MSPWHAIRTATAAEYANFRQALEDPAAAQHDQLMRIIATNRETTFGRSHGFDRIRNPDDYRGRVPIQTWETLAPEIDAMMAGADNRLCGEYPLLYERTSGTGAAPKHIPYPPAALAAFRRAIHPWLHDLACHHPGLASGRAWFAISPAARPEATTTDGTPIGMADDSAYFGEAVQPLLARLPALPPALAGISDLDDWRYLTLRLLLEADDLTLISVWSPTFLSTLLDTLKTLAEPLISDLSSGRVSVPGDWGPIRPRPERAAALEAALSGPFPDGRRLWPNLALISCWTHGTSARFLEPLRRAFPHAAIQGKGLLATEGVVSIPLAQYPYPVLTPNSGFYEFLDENDRSHLAHELDPESEYRVLLTTPGGLYRYAIGDRIRVRGHAGRTPLLEFTGRTGVGCDLCGEKLTEAQVQAALAGIGGFAMLAPSLEDRPHYVLLLDSSEPEQRGTTDRVDAVLRANPQYDYARRLGQLGPVHVERLERPLEHFLAWCTAQGRRLGDVKPPLLYTDPDWRRVFAPATDLKRDNGQE